MRRFFKDPQLNLYRLILCIVACYVVIFCYDFAFHVGVLMPSYVATAHVWNTDTTMSGRQDWYALFEFMVAMVLSVFYYCWRHQSAGRVPARSQAAILRDSVGFGGFAGLLMGISMAVFYVYLPIPLSIALAWLAGEVVKGMLLGVVLAWMYPKPRASAV